MLRKVFFPLLLVIALTGCTAKEYEWVIKIDDRPVDPDTYVSAQMQSYMEAQTLAEDSTDVLGSTIDGMSGSRWIEQNTINSLKRKVFIDREFEKQHLKFAEGADKFIKMFGEEGWENVSRIYAKNGLEIEYYIEHLKSIYKEQLLFNAIFLSDDENAVTDREIEEYLNSHLCRVSLFKVAKQNYDGTPLEEDSENSLISLVDDTVERINNGQSMVSAAGRCLTQAAVLLGDNGDYSDGADYVSTVLVSNSGARLVYDFMKDLFHQPQGKCLYYELDDAYYICQRIPLCDTQVEYMFMKQEVAGLLRDVEFEQMVKQGCELMTVELNREAVNAYAPSKIDITVD